MHKSSRGDSRGNFFKFTRSRPEFAASDRQAILSFRPIRVKHQFKESRRKLRLTSANASGNGRKFCF